MPTKQKQELGTAVANVVTRIKSVHWKITEQRKHENVWVRRVASSEALLLLEAMLEHSNYLIHEVERDEYSDYRIDRLEAEARDIYYTLRNLRRAEAMESTTGRTEDEAAAFERRAQEYRDRITGG